MGLFVFRDDCDLTNKFRSYLQRKEFELSRKEFVHLRRLLENVVVEQRFELINEETRSILAEFVETVLKSVSCEELPYRRELDDEFSRLSVGSGTVGGEGSFGESVDGPVR